jgi:hypothetical protein
VASSVSALTRGEGVAFTGGRALPDQREVSARLRAIPRPRRSDGTTTRADTPVAIESDGVEVRKREIGGDMTVAFVHLPAGTDLGPALARLPGDLCPCPHRGYLLSGRMEMRTKDGVDVYEAGQAFYWSPDHAPRALEDIDYVDFSPTSEFDAVVAHITGAGAGTS